MIKILVILLAVTTIYSEELSTYHDTSNIETNTGKPTINVNPQARVINGVEVSIDSEKWEFIGALKLNGIHYCGGSLIAPNWLLTAAHCVDTRVPISQDTVGVGNYNINYTTEQSVKRFIVHPEYNSTTLDNDIALIELQNNVTNIAPIVYDTSYTLAVDTPTEVAGWGNMSTTSEVFPTSLMEALVPIVDLDTCNTHYEGNITSNMFCAGYFDGTKDSCQGDSGGPLVVNNSLVGIVSWGAGCAEENFPGVYTKVQNYDDWIKNAQSYKKVLATSDSVSLNGFKYYRIPANKGQSLNVTLTSLSADVDLYVKAGSNPTTTSFDCVSGNYETSGEVCAIASDKDIYIGVYGFKAGSYDLEVISMGGENIEKKWLIMPVMDGMNIPIPYK
ncbi:MAG: trypsin-like serine protease [Campylobacterota bacterium]|nr:trypsin-like serine protease [Campylobacterota bacterium]